MEKKVLISLHDAAPHHLSRLKRIETFFEELAVPSVSYLLIPDYHYHSKTVSKETGEAFYRWCNRSRPFRVQWILHGYSHIQDLTSSGQHRKIHDFINRKIKTAGEGEFESLPPEEIRARIRKGSAHFETVLGTRPRDFIAPAWIFNSDLTGVLKDEGFITTENHRHIFNLQENRTIPVPVITWATRNVFLKTLSIIGCPILHRIWSSKPVLRIAVHPYDFDHPGTVRNIRTVLKKVLAHRQAVTYREIFSD